MADQVTITSRLVNPATGDGVQLSALSVAVRNQRWALQDTLVYPAGITQVITGSDYAYKITDYDVSDREKFPGEYVFFEYTGTSLVGSQTVVWVEEELFNTNFAVTVPEGREAYATLAEATQFFQTRRDWEMWERLAVPDSGKALRYLITASDDIDREKYKGRKLRVYAFDAERASRQFPRIFDASEVYAAFSTTSEILPVSLKHACAVQALYLMQQDDRAHDIDARRDLQSQGLTGLSRGDSNETWDLKEARQHRLCQEAYHFLKPYLATTVVDHPGSL